MSDPRERAAELRPDLDIPWSDKRLMVPIFNVLGPTLLHPDVHFEGGEAGQAVWKEQVESDAPTMVIMSHPEEVDAVLMAPITQGGLTGTITRNSPLRQMRYETLVTAKRPLRNAPFGIGWIVRNGGTTPVDRPYDSPHETQEQKDRRQEENLHNRDIASTVMEAGGNMVYFIEGGTDRRIKLPDGSYKRVPRKKDEMLPAQAGFAHAINSTSPETREKMRIMTVVSRYRRSPLRLLRPTVVILDPVKPVDGTVEEVRQQGENLMAKGFELVIELDKLR